MYKVLYEVSLDGKLTSIETVVDAEDYIYDDDALTFTVGRGDLTRIVALFVTRCLVSVVEVKNN